ncbi:Clan CF, family C15, pyroglutamyl peptidase I-like cysteine peptidase [Tritrichomonas foetus]|uniref:Clan CF, family C15, pyroglutamyl peptidase I-like cysteine peptidase n=1 Tax=Tritrichomonas foetus TaxID=1144522 RepID=A0A1J4K571_9EUKA|nr:Clan CF, family C15, pyroglutamyl peptidase I-like cysteine peptidase [Tritrichomonas foetus]|eukprot:OHT04868.1 Clan CF, family C15, pyroglutamyl peptidase I-like cysteine peptidase [Tritrichomonas foetus]
MVSVFIETNFFDNQLLLFPYLYGLLFITMGHINIEKITVDNLHMIFLNSNLVDDIKILMKFIITGFGPFGSIIENPSREIALSASQELNRQGTEATFLDWRVAMSEPDNFYRDLEPSDTFVVHIGVYSGIKKMHMEVQGINNADFGIPDDDGKQPQNEPIDENYPHNYELMNVLPIKDWVQVLPQYYEISYSAGTYVCNYTYFRALTNVGRKTRGTIFIHVAEFKDFNKEFQVAGVVKLVHMIESHFR